MCVKNKPTKGHLYHFTLGNFIVVASLAVWNDVLMKKLEIINNDNYTYDRYYKLGFLTVHVVVCTLKLYV